MQKIYSNQKLKKFVRLLATAASCAGLLLATTEQTQAQLAPANCKFLGNIIANSVPTGFGTYWNQVTPENSGKWGSAEATRDVMSWQSLDVAYNYTRSKSLPFKQHAFVWGQQQPGWIDALTAEEQRAEVEEWIRLYSERYPATEMVDVVNEPLHAPPTYRGALGGSGTTGWDWVIWSFEKARHYMPNAKLLLNDYNILNSTSKTATYVSIIKLLKDRGLIDGIGLQAHFLETTPLSTIKANLNTLAATGIPIYISEYDVNIADSQLQKAKYQEQFPVLWQHPGVGGITLWGYRQGQIWRTDAYLINSDGSERAAMTWLKQYMTTEGYKYCSTPTGINESQLERNINIYPNPASKGNFTLELSNEVYEQLQILNLKGQVVQTLPLHNQSQLKISLPLAPGIYVLQFSNSKQLVSKRLVVQ